MTEDIPGTFVCLFCQGVISMRSGDSDKFRLHLEVYHEVFTHWQIILAINFLKEEEQENIVTAVQDRIDKVQDIGVQVKQEILVFLDDNKVEESNIDQEEFIGDKEIVGNPIKESSLGEKETIRLTESENKVDESERASCSFCGRKLDNIHAIEEHRKHSQKYFSCEKCGMKFNIASKLKRHLEENKKSCDVNLNIFELKHIAVTEKLCNIGEDGENFSCSLCQRTFKGRKLLQNHITKKVCLKFHACEMCGKKFKRISKLKRHLNDMKRSCTETNDCKTCGRMFKDRRSSERHLCTDTIVCKNCGQMFKDRRSSDRHKRRNSCDVTMLENKLLMENDWIHLVENYQMQGEVAENNRIQRLTASTASLSSAVTVKFI